jgi:hypothetical protein
VDLPLLCRLAHLTYCRPVDSISLGSYPPWFGGMGLVSDSFRSPVSERKSYQGAMNPSVAIPDCLKPILKLKRPMSDTVDTTESIIGHIHNKRTFQVHFPCVREIALYFPVQCFPRSERALLLRFRLCRLFVMAVEGECEG